MPDKTILDHVAKIVAAHVENNAVDAGALPDLIRAVYDSLDSLGKPPRVIEEKRQPAVSIRSSVKPDSIACLECGTKMKMLKRHLGTDHNLSVDEYKQRWNLPLDYPLVAPDYAAIRRDLAKTIGLGRKKAVPAKPAPKPRRARTPKPAPTPEPIAEAAEAAEVA